MGEECCCQAVVGNRCIYLIMYHGARHIGDGQLVMTLTLPYGSKIQGGRGQRDIRHYVAMGLYVAFGRNVL